MHSRTSQVKQHGSSPSRIHAFADSARFAQQLGRAVGMKVARVEVHRFPDGESLVRICAAGVRKILSCDTVPHPTNAIRSAPLVAAALQATVL